MRPLEEVEKKSPVAQRKRGKQNGNWVLGGAYGLGPWTAAGGGNAPPAPEICCSSYICTRIVK